MVFVLRLLTSYDVHFVFVVLTLFLFCAICCDLIFILRLLSWHDFRFAHTGVTLFSFCSYLCDMLLILRIQSWYDFYFGHTVISWFSLILLLRSLDDLDFASAVLTSFWFSACWSEMIVVFSVLPFPHFHFVSSSGMLFIVRLLVEHDFHFARDVRTWLLFYPYWRGTIFILHLLVPQNFILRWLSLHIFILHLLA